MFVIFNNTTDAVYTRDKICYPQALLKECKYKVKQKTI